MIKLRMVKIPVGQSQYKYEVQRRRWFMWKTIETIAGDVDNEWKRIVREHMNDREIIAVARISKGKVLEH